MATSMAFVIPALLAVVALFIIFFIYLYRIYKRLQIRHAKPPPNVIPPELEQHHELAFVLAHGVEAYNQLRRQRQQQQRRQSGGNIPEGNDNTSIASSSSHPSISAAAAIEPPPAYTATPAEGDIGYGWRAVGQTGIFGPPGMTTSSTTTTQQQHQHVQHPLETLPPVYIYQSPVARTMVQTALLTTDNSPTVTLSRQQGRRNSSRGGRNERGASVLVDEGRGGLEASASAAETTTTTPEVSSGSASSTGNQIVHSTGIADVESEMQVLPRRECGIQQEPISPSTSTVMAEMNGVSSPSTFTSPPAISS